VLFFVSWRHIGTTRPFCSVFLTRGISATNGLSSFSLILYVKNLGRRRMQGAQRAGMKVPETGVFGSFGEGLTRTTISWQLRVVVGFPLPELFGDGGSHL